LEDCPISPPSQMLRSVRTNCAVMEPFACDPINSNALPKRFAAIQGADLYIFDIEQEKSLISEKVLKYLTSDKRLCPF
jgi:hypothetical protein